MVKKWKIVYIGCTAAAKPFKLLITCKGIKRP